MANPIVNFLSRVGAKAKNTTSIIANTKKLPISKRRFLGAAGSLAGGFVGAQIMKENSARERNYMGDAAYQNKYKGAPELISGALPYLGAYNAAMTAFTKSSIFHLGKRSIGTAHNLLLRGRPKMESLNPIQILGGAAMAIGATATYNAVGTAQLLAGGAALAGYGAAVKTFGPVGPTLVAGAAVGMGVLATSRAAYPAGEGNITDFRAAGESPSRKMDFNTAGLVQALHHNRKVM